MSTSIQTSFRVAREASLDHATIGDSQVVPIVLSPLLGSLPVVGVVAYCSRLGAQISIDLTGIPATATISGGSIVLVGLPIECAPLIQVSIPIVVIENGAQVMGTATISTSGQITIVPLSGSFVANQTYGYLATSLSYVSA